MVLGSSPREPTKYIRREAKNDNENGGFDCNTDGGSFYYRFRCYVESGMKTGDLVRVLKYGGRHLPDGSMGIIIEHNLSPEKYSLSMSKVHYFNGVTQIGLSQYLEVVDKR